MPGPIYTAGRTPLSSAIVDAGGVIQAAALPATPWQAKTNPLVFTGQSAGVSQPVLKTESLVDDFSAVDTAKFTYNGTATVTGGQAASVPTSGYINSITSVQLLDLTSSSMSIEMVAAPTGNGSIGVFFSFYEEVSGDVVGFQVESGELRFREIIASTPSVTSVTYDSVAHRWLRLTHDGTDLLWETSPDRVTWTTARTKAPGRIWNVGAIQINSGFYGTEPTPGTALFDNLNTAPISVNAAAGTASGAGTADDAVTALAVAAENAAGTGAAGAAAASAAPNADNPVAAGAAPDAAAAVAASAEGPSGAGAAGDPAASPAVNAENPSGSGSANDAGASVTVFAECATGTGTANDPTVQTGTFTNANAECATASGVANDAAASLAPAADNAVGTGSGHDAAASPAAQAEAAAGTGAGNNAGPAVAPSAESAAATGLGIDVGSLTILANAEAATALAAALDATIGGGEFNAASTAAVTAGRTSTAAVTGRATSAAFVSDG